jgi:hypothetical protein
MSLFAGLQRGGIKGPDVVINGDGGSLLPTNDGIRFSDAKINQTPSLLGGVQPYKYGPGSTSDDITYGVTPHKIQKIVPQLALPSEENKIEDDNLILSHSVDDGDFAFTIRMVHDVASRIKDYSFMAKQNITRAVDPIVNICTVNFILRGLQTKMDSNQENWRSFLASTGWPEGNDGMRLEDFQTGKHQHRNVSMFIQDFIRPLGVVIGSEMQGGQHQGSGGGGVDFPVDFVVTILVDGLCDNMLNLWKRTEIRAGDDLFFALCGTQMADDRWTDNDNQQIHHRKKGLLKYQFSSKDDSNGGLINTKNFMSATFETTYVLNHWAKGQITRRFKSTPGLLFELVPTTSTEINEGVFLCDSRKNRGLWHVARSQVHIRGSPNTPSVNKQTFRQDTANLKGGGLVQATIAPVWKSASKHHNSEHSLNNAVFVHAMEYHHEYPEHRHQHTPVTVHGPGYTNLPSKHDDVQRQIHHVPKQIPGRVARSKGHHENGPVVAHRHDNNYSASLSTESRPIKRPSQTGNSDDNHDSTDNAAANHTAKRQANGVSQRAGVKIKKSLMEPPTVDTMKTNVGSVASNATDVHENQVSYTSQTPSNVANESMSTTSSETNSKGNSQSVTAISGGVGSRSVSVARVSAKARVESES